MSEEVTMHKFGTEEFPIPIADKLTGEITWLASEEDAVYIPTMRKESKEAVYGRLIRQVVTDPSMMKDMTEILLRLDKSRTPKDSKSYGYTTMGAPGNGKTFLSKAIGELVHPRGALVVDCNSMDNPDELFKVTTFSVDQTHKQRKIDAKIKMGNRDPEQAISQNAIAYMKKMFGNDVVTQETRDDRRITAIDWNGIRESSAYIEEVLDKVMEMENIPNDKKENSLGFVVSNGPLLRALIDKDSPDYGRMIVRDESNRGPVVDAWLKIQAFFSEPGVEELKLKGEDDREFTIKRSDIPDTFMFLGTANHAVDSMGTSAKEMTKPMISREGMGIDIRLMSDPEKEDYISRVLKHMTGVPAYHVFKMDPETFTEDPSLLSEALMYFRTVGLSKEEIKRIPQDEIFNIKHIDRTIQVATSYGALLSEADKLIAATAKDESLELPERYVSYLENEAVVDLRYAYKILQHAKINQPKGKKGAGVFAKLGQAKAVQTNEDSNWDMNKRIAKREKNQLLVRGVSLENEVATRLHNIIMPDSLNSMLRESENPEDNMEKISGLWQALKQTAKGLNFEFAGYVGEDSVAKTYNARIEDFPNIAIEDVKEVLVASMQEEYKEELGQANLVAGDIIDDDKLSEALQMLAKSSDDQKIFIPNYDLETMSEQPFKGVHVIAKDREVETIDRESLITANEFADSIIIKDMRKHNMAKLEKETPFVERGKLDIDEKIAEIAYGKDQNFFTSCVLVNDKENERVGLASIIYNKNNQEMIVLADFNVSDDDREKMRKNGIFYVNVNEVNNKNDYSIIADFLNRQTRNFQDIGNSQLVSALMLRIDPELATGSSEDASDLCQYINMLSQEDNKWRDLDAVQMTNVEYGTSPKINTMIEANLRRRGR